MKRAEVLELKRKQALELKLARDQRTPQDQLAILDKRLGKGKGAKKERRKLTEQIESAKL